MKHFDLRKQMEQAVAEYAAEIRLDRTFSGSRYIVFGLRASSPEVVEALKNIIRLLGDEAEHSFQGVI